MDRLAEQLRAFVADVLGEPQVEVRNLDQLTGGASRETWSFEAATPGGATRRLILRRDPPSEARAGGLAQEACAIEAASLAGVPEPRVLAWGDDRERAGAPFILMERVEGETLPRRILHDEVFAETRERLAEECGEILARIHSVPVEAVPGLRAYDALEDLRATLDSFDDASPQLELGLRWLERHRPPVSPATLVHGDFRNGNLVVGPDGVRAVLDWELVHRGDPMEDLGYLCVRAWRFGGERPVGGFGDYEDLFRGYERVSGHRIDLDVVRWWELVGTVWWGAACMTQAWRHLSGEVRSVELAAIGRRVWEQEYDAMVLVGELMETA